MAATLYSIDAALYAALSALQTDQTTGPTAARPFALVGRFVGDVSGAAGASALVEACAQFPCALLRFDEERDDRDVDTVSGASEERSRCQWTVLIGVEDPRGIDDAMAAASGSGVPGVLALTGSVMAALNGLRVTELWHWRRVRHVATRPLLVQRGSLYVFGMVFEALRVAEQATVTETTTPLTSVRGEVNLINPPAPAPADPTNPFETFDADT